MDNEISLIVHFTLSIVNYFSLALKNSSVLL